MISEVKTRDKGIEVFKVVIMGLLVLLSFYLVSAEEKNVIFHETFDSLESIEDNDGEIIHYIDIDSEFVSGLDKDALHLKSSERVEYELEEISQEMDDLNKGSIDFYFKTYDEDMKHGLINLYVGGEDGNILTSENPMVFINYYRLWSELKIGGYHQIMSKSEVSQKKWHHVALVWGSKDRYELYLDGEKVKGYKGKLDFSNPFELVVGESFWYGWGEAVFDDLKIYDYILSGKEIKERAELIENDPDKDVLELLFPEDGVTAEIPNNPHLVINKEFSWTGPSGKYRAEVSTDPDFEKTVKLRGFYSKTSAKNMFHAWLEIKDLKKLLKKTKYTGNDFYWRVSVKGSKNVYSETREVEILYKGSDPDLELTPGTEIEENDLIFWDLNRNLEADVEVSGDEDFEGEIIKLKRDSYSIYPPDSMRISKERYNQLKNLAKKTGSNTLYMRIKAEDILGDIYFSESIMFKVV